MTDQTVSPPPAASPTASDPIDEFIKLPKDQQLSTLQQLAPEKQDKLLAKVKERRNNAGGSGSGSVAAPVPAVTKTAPGFLDPHTENGIGSRIGEFVRGATAGVVNPILHPIDTLMGMGQAAMAGSTPYGTPITAPTGNAARDEATNRVLDTNRQNVVEGAGTMMREHPAYLAGSVAGPAAIGEVGRAIPKVARGAADILAGTRGATERGVGEVAKTNEAAIADAAAKNAKIDADRAAALKAHGEKISQAKAENAAISEKQARKVALQRGVEKLDPQLKEDLAATHARVKARADAKYNDLNAKLNDEEASPEVLGGMLSSFGENLKGSDNLPPVVRDMEKKFNSNQPLSYRDLQGYRSEIGHELSRGNLPGDVYQGYKALQDNITNEMERIADSKGLGDQLRDARSTYAQYANTFLDPNSPVKKALNSTERGGVVKAFAGKDQSGIEALAQHDPELARKINTVRGYQKEASGIRSSTPTAPKTVKPLPPKPAPVQPEITQLGPEDLTRMKQEAVLKRADKIRNSSDHLANTVVALDAIRSLIAGNPEHIGTDLAARGVYGAGKHGLAAVLESPRVVEFLSRPTADDLANLSKLPPDQRAATAQLVNAAQAKGIRVSPAVLSAVGVSVGLPQNHALAR